MTKIIVNPSQSSPVYDDAGEGVAGTDVLSWETGKTQEDQQNIQTMYQLRLNMARGHAAKTRILRGQLASLDASYATTRLQIDRELVAPQSLNLLLFTSDEIVERENLPAQDCGPLADARRNLRKKVLSKLLDNMEKIIIDFRIAVSAAGRENASYETLAGYIFEFHLADCLADLSPTDAKQLRRHIAISADRVGDLIDLTCNYPLLQSQTVNIYQKDQIEAFYGHLIAVISGLHRKFYEYYQAKRKSIQKELSDYAPETSGLPALDSFGDMAEQMRIHLLCKIFHQRLENQTDDSRTTPGTNHPQALLAHYENFGKTRDTKAIVEEFNSLPEISILREGINRVLNKNTRRKIFDRLSEQVVVPWLLDKTYELMCAIYDLDQLGRSGNEEAVAMSRQFGQELTRIFQKTASIKKPADQSIIEGLFHDMTDMVQLAEFCYRELKGN